MSMREKTKFNMCVENQTRYYIWSQINIDLKHWIREEMFTFGPLRSILEANWFITRKLKKDVNRT